MIDPAAEQLNRQERTLGGSPRSYHSLQDDLASHSQRFSWPSPRVYLCLDLALSDTYRAFKATEQVSSAQASTVFSHFYRVQSSSSSRASCLLRLTLLLDQHLLSEHLLNHPQVVRLAVDHILQLLDVARKLLNLAVVECERVLGGLLHVEASSDINEYVASACEFARDVERGGQRDEQSFV